MSEPKIVPYVTAEKLRELNRRLGKEISRDYAGKLAPGEELLIVITLKGAVFFAADLVREITVPCRVDFVRVASYGAGTKSSGTVRFLKDIEVAPEGKHVIIVDEIVDSGRTLKFLSARIQAAGPKSIRICALLSKPSRREVEVDVAYLGQEVEDKFLIGYGLDYAEKYRNMDYVGYLET